MIHRRRMLGFAAALMAAPPIARAQGFPTRPVTIFVPFAAGGAVDVVARTVADRLAAKWGVHPVIENRPGAGGVVATQALARSPADGHTLMVAANGHPLNRFFFERLSYDSDRDFTPLTQIATSPLVVSVNRANDAADARAFFAAARARPEGINFGVSGFGTSAHLAGILIGQATGAKLIAVPHRSGTQALQTVIGGDLPMSINPLLEAMALARAGRVRALAVTSARRSPALPEVPTLAEQGLTGFEAAVWWGFVAPAGLPGPIEERLAHDLREAVRAPETLARLEQLGATPVASTQAEFVAFLAAETAKWGPIIRAANVRIE